MRVIPETYTKEGADTHAWSRRRHRLQPMPMQLGLPGTSAHIESPGRTMEQERPRVNHRMVTVGVVRRGRTEASPCEWSLGVGLSHSSEEASEGGSRVGGAKGRAGQGTRRRES